jgi:hypothetical protein
VGLFFFYWQIWSSFNTVACQRWMATLCGLLCSQALWLQPFSSFSGFQRAIEGHFSPRFEVGLESRFSFSAHWFLFGEPSEVC